MSFRKTPIALGVVAICAGASFGAQAAPSITITSPSNNATVSGTVNCSANASDSSGISNVAFYLDGIGLNTDTASPYVCKSFSTSSYKSGAHTRKAVATAKNGSKTTTQITLNFGTSTSGGSSGGTSGGNPVVAITRPANGTTFSSSTGGVKCHGRVCERWYGRSCTR